MAQTYIFSSTTDAKVVTPCQVRLSAWQEFKANLGRFLSSLMCCGNSPDLIADFEADNKFRSEVRQCMMEVRGMAADTNLVEAAIIETVAKDNVLIGGIDHVRKANAGVARTFKQWHAYEKSVGVDLVSGALKSKPAVKVPRFAAACTLELRSRLGRMEPTEANILLAERKYNEICRKRGVHTADAQRHLAHVLNALFTEDVLEVVASTRRRAPRWLRWAWGVTHSSPSFKPM